MKVTLKVLRYVRNRWSTPLCSALPALSASSTKGKSTIKDLLLSVSQTLYVSDPIFLCLLQMCIERGTQRMCRALLSYYTGWSFLSRQNRNSNVFSWMYSIWIYPCILLTSHVRPPYILTMLCFFSLFIRISLSFFLSKKVSPRVSAHFFEMFWCHWISCRELFLHGSFTMFNGSPRG